jgi:uncharacterized DUF497 family protein
VKITFDPVKRADTWAKRKIDFVDAAEVFAGATVDIPDLRRDYGEGRIVSYGLFRGRMVVVVWTQRGDAHHIISMRKANDREKARYRHRLGGA